MVRIKQNAIIRNSWYCIEKELIKLFILLFILAIPILITTYTTNNIEIIYGFLGGISTITVTTPNNIRKKDKASQWGKFMYTLPIPRNEIVKSQFKFFELITLLFSSFVVATLALTIMLPFGVDLEKVSLVLVMSISIGLVGQSLMYVFSLAADDTINDFMYVIAILVSIIPSVLPDIILNHYFETYSIIAYIIFSLILIITIEFICYCICNKISQVKDI